jgi:hypothetical protein
MSYLLVLSAVGTLASSEVLPQGSALVFLIFAAISWFFDAQGRPAEILDRGSAVSKLVVFGFFAYSVWQVWSRLPEPDLAPILDLVMFLLAFKLFHRRGNRDYLQIYILSFLLVLAAAALAQSFLFSVGFALYVVLATWTLILFHLRREMEENYLVKHSAQAPSQKVGVNRILNSRRVVGPAFFVATGVVAVVVFAGAVSTFALVPRIGAGFVLGGPRPAKNLIGFSDEVSLGHYGVLGSDNNVVALRATIPRIAALPTERQRDREIERLYWRGTVYDTYESGHWLRSRRPELRTQLESHHGRLIIHEPRLETPRVSQSPHAAGASLQGTERHEIHIVGLTVPVAFAIDHPVAFELPASKLGGLGELRLAPRWSGEVALRLNRPDLAHGHGEEMRAFSGAHYVAYSRDPLSMARAAGGRPIREIDPAALRPYLALPSSLAPRVVELAQQITVGKTNPPAKLLAIIEWLRSTHTYTTKLRRNFAIADPLEDFLFEQSAGHCEYFASATVVLLRASGVPSRYVNGFLGGEWNDLGQYVTVRDNRAHSWAEAYLGEMGWMRVDATPPSRGNFRMGRLRQLFDSLDFFWNRWVVGYDLGRQVELARRLGQQIGVGGEAAGPRRLRLPSLQTVGYLLGSVALCIFLIRLLPRFRRPRLARGAAAVDQTAPIFRLYRRSLRRLVRRGYLRRPSETPREFAERLATANIRGTEAMERLTDLYGAARFGGQAIDEEVVADLARDLAVLGNPHPPTPPG